MSFQAVGPEDPKERGPKLVVQDRGTSSLFASKQFIACTVHWLFPISEHFQNTCWNTSIIGFLPGSGIFSHTVTTNASK